MRTNSKRCVLFAALPMAFIVGCDSEWHMNDGYAFGRAEGNTGTDTDSGVAVGESARDQNPPSLVPLFDNGPWPSEEPSVIDEDYGVFVHHRGTDRGECGSRTVPCRTVSEGIRRAKSAGKRVYVCGTAGTYTERVTFRTSTDGLKVFGGFRCEDWTYHPESIRSRVEPFAGHALVVDGLLEGLEVHDFEFATIGRPNHQSPIAAWVRNSKGVVFRRTAFIGGPGAKGKNGVGGADGGTPSSSLMSHANAVGVVGGYLGGGSPCGSEEGSLGGNGGYGGISGGGVGWPIAGVRPPVEGEAGALGGVGSINGENGGNGSRGETGAHSDPADVGAFGLGGFYRGCASTGAIGHPGQGGGGGGGGFWTEALDCSAGGGGAGGFGGCGGKGATGGIGGDASVGLLTWSSFVTLDSCELSSDSGGDGGDGGRGGTGSVGLNGGTGAEASGATPEFCGKGGRGGRGGDGGDGGSGSGGPGGPSHALVVNASAYGWLKLINTTLVWGPGGDGGLGGRSAHGDSAPDGPAGASSDILIVP